MLAEGYARLGQVDKALSCLAEAAPKYRGYNERYHEAELHPLLLTACFARAAEEAQIYRPGTGSALILQLTP
jgi:hypothetical protein